MAAMPYDYDKLYKLLLIGDSFVGKSSLLLRFADGACPETPPGTIGVDFKMRTVEQNGKTIKLQLWDPAGNERFRTIVLSYFRGAHGFIVVYDVTNKDSFNHVRAWFQEIEKYSADGVKKLLVGNKCDMHDEKVVSYEEGLELARSLDVQFIETSARDSQNVDLAFQTLVREIMPVIRVVTLFSMPSDDGLSVSCVSIAGTELARIDIQNGMLVEDFLEQLFEALQQSFIMCHVIAESGEAISREQFKMPISKLLTATGQGSGNSPRSHASQRLRSVVPFGTQYSRRSMATEIIADCDDIVKEGWLVKQSKVLKQWRRRWCVLTKKYLCSFKSQGELRNPTEAIRLLECSILESAYLDTLKSNSFRVGTSERVFYFIANTEIDRESWMGRIRDGMGHRRRPAWDS